MDIKDFMLKWGAQLPSELIEEALEGDEGRSLMIRDLADDLRNLLGAQPIRCRLIVTFEDGTELAHATGDFTPGPDGVEHGGGVVRNEVRLVSGFKLRWDGEALRPDGSKGCSFAANDSDPRWAGKKIVKEEIELPGGKRVPS